MKLIIIELYNFLTINSINVQVVDNDVPVLHFKAIYKHLDLVKYR